MGTRALAFLAGVLATGGWARAAPHEPAVAIVGVTVIDVEHGRSIGPRTERRDLLPSARV